MKALQRYEYGDWQSLKMVDSILPKPKAKEVLVKISYAAIDSGMVHLISGLPKVVRLGTGFSTPKNPFVGQSMSGVISKLGPGVTEFQVGDEVFGVGTGVFAEHAIAKTSKLAIVPTGMTLAQAASFPVSAVAALAAIEAAPDSISTATVLGASGGVGSFLTALLAKQKVEITGTCSESKADWVRSLGANSVIGHDDLDQIPLASQDRIFITGGPQAAKEFKKYLKPKGKVIMIGSDNAGSEVFGGFFTNLLQAAIHPWIKTIVSAEKPEKLLTAARELRNTEGVFTVVNGLENSIEAIKDFQQGKVVGRSVIQVTAENRGSRQI